MDSSWVTIRELCNHIMLCFPCLTRAGWGPCEKLMVSFQGILRPDMILDVERDVNLWHEHYHMGDWFISKCRNEVCQNHSGWVFSIDSGLHGYFRLSFCLLVIELMIQIFVSGCRFKSYRVCRLYLVSENAVFLGQRKVGRAKELMKIRKESAKVQA